MAGSEKLFPNPSPVTEHGASQARKSSAALISALSAKAATKAGKAEMRDQFTDLFKLKPSSLTTSRDRLRKSVSISDPPTLPPILKLPSEGTSGNEVLLRPRLLKQKRCELLTPPTSPARPTRLNGQPVKNGSVLFSIGGTVDNELGGILPPMTVVRPESGLYDDVPVSADGKFNDMHLESASMRRRSLFVRVKTFFSESKDHESDAEARKDSCEVKYQVEDGKLKEAITTISYLQRCRYSVFHNFCQKN